MIAVDQRISKIAETALAGGDVSREEGEYLVRLTPRARGSLYDLLYWANNIRRAFHGDRVSLCSVVSARQGSCAEDCKFCAQSVHHRTSVAAHPMLAKENIRQAAESARGMGSARFGIVTSGESACEGDDWPGVLEAVKAVVEMGGIIPCASVGSLTEEAAAQLKTAGLQRYHHNLETSEAHFAEICTTHSYQDRVDTVRIAKAAGLEVCSGGIFGVGETWDDRLDLAFALRALGVDSVPINFLNPIPGTPLEHAEPMPPMDLLKIIALFRFILPKQEIRVCGGREVNLRDLQSWMFCAGANGTMIGNYLTTQGRCAAEDRQMLRDLELST